ASGLLLMNYVRCRRAGYRGGGEALSIGKIATACYKGFWSLLAPLVILGGIYAGLFTPTEAAIVAIFYTLFVGIFIYREIRLKEIFASLEATTWLTGRVLLVLFTATIFGRILVENQIPAHLASALLSFTQNIYVIWAMIVAFLLFVGMFMETL